MVACLSEGNDLSNPDVYINVLHMMTCLEVPIFIYGAVCILFKTPAKMNSVKWLIFSLHLLSGLTDFGLSFLTIPLVYLPAVAGIPLGVLNYPRPSLFAISAAVAMVAVLILTIFENRFYVLFGMKTWWKRVRRPFLIGNFFLASTYCIPPFLMLPNQWEGVEIVKKMLPCTPATSIDNHEIFVYTVDVTIPFCCYALATTLIASEILSFFGILFSMMILRDSGVSSTSTKTNNMQKKFVMALSLQTLLPFVVLLTPMVYILAAVVLSYHNQSINNLMFCLLASHGSASTIIMLFVHLPYRQLTLSPFYRIFRTSTVETAHGAKAIFNLNSKELKRINVAMIS